ncbi:uncharacterized protein LOC124145125 [Haliotis rufescens]|uniref:uncharacterized protein LOC124145125 n=1 Tax=Haliotis rufescens TaxID=6454 RepID=UPI00201F7313|nr:uncharacterized protein LOC124145125 [Haliotis rufescens]
MAPTYVSGLLLTLLVPVVACSVLSRLPVQQVCMADTDCAQNECCGKRTGPLIVSKRQLSSIQGTCKPYLHENEWCYGQWKQNGDCGCAPSQTCQYFPPTTPTLIQAIGKRRPAPGEYLCKHKQ